MTAYVFVKKNVLFLLIFLTITVGCDFNGTNNKINPDSNSSSDSSNVKHVILIIGDGMQLHHEVAASRYLYGNDNGLSFNSFEYKTYVATWDVTTYNRYAYAQAPAAARYSAENFNASIGYDVLKGGAYPSPLITIPAETYFLTKLAPYGGGGTAIPATDSASAATALATGFKTDDGNIAWLPGDPAGGQITTIAEQLRSKKGFAIGVVSTVPFTHATPAAFVSHNVSRSNNLAIGNEIITSVKPDVVIGGGHRGWILSYVNEADVNTLKASSEYVYVERIVGQNGGTALINAANTAVAQGKKLFGLYGGTGGNFESPVPSDTPGTPSFTVNTENPTLAQAATAALTVLSQDPDGFFIMIEQGDIDWANHARDYARMVGTVNDLDEGVKAVTAFVDKSGDDITWDNTLVIVTSDHGNSYMRLNPAITRGKGDLPTQTGTTTFTYPDGDVTYNLNIGHSNELVTLYARGAGTNYLRDYENDWYPARIIDNTQIYKGMARAAGLE